MEPTGPFEEQVLSETPKEEKPVDVEDSSESYAPESSASEDPFVSNLPKTSYTAMNEKSSSSSRGPASALGNK